MMASNPGGNGMWSREEEWDNIQKGWLNSGQEKRYYANQGAGMLLFIIIVFGVYFFSKFFK